MNNRQVLVRVYRVVNRPKSGILGDLLLYSFNVDLELRVPMKPAAGNNIRIVSIRAAKQPYSAREDKNQCPYYNKS